VYKNRGVFYKRTGQNEKALMDFKKALSIDSMDIEIIKYVEETQSEINFK
ncbi:MAG: tetratricopeptide repeat protein, partial [Bacteroidota bacterium]